METNNNVKTELELYGSVLIVAIPKLSSIEVDGKIINVNVFTDGKKDSDSFWKLWGIETFEFIKSHAYQCGIMEIVQKKGETFKEGQKILHAFRCNGSVVNVTNFTIGKVVGDFESLESKSSVQTLWNESTEEMGFYLLVKPHNSESYLRSFIPLFKYPKSDVQLGKQLGGVEWPVIRDDSVKSKLNIMKFITKVSLPDLVYKIQIGYYAETNRVSRKKTIDRTFIVIRNGESNQEIETSKGIAD